MKNRYTFKITLVFILLLSTVAGIPSPLAIQAADTSEGYEIYPIPHSVVYDDAVTSLDQEIQIIYDETIDKATRDKTEQVMERYGFENLEIGTVPSENKLNVLIGTKDSGGPADAYAAEHFHTDNMNFDKIDAYQFDIEDNFISIIGKDTDASFYGVVSLEAVISQVTDSTVKNLHIEDYANTKIRGFIEGYYGIPWSNEDRMSLMEFGGQFKATSYIFAPKDDPYHRQQWDEPYPEEKLEEIRQLAEVGNKTKTRFVWTISPLGEVAQIARNQGQEAAMALLEENTEKMLHKFDQLYDVGVRQFGVLGDDVGSLPLDYVVGLMEAVAEWADEKGDVYDILYCPASYNSAWAWDGGRELNRLEQGFPDNIQIFWTGENTVGKVEQYTVDRFKTRDNNGVERRDPLFWLNWPVNDVDMTRVFLGKGEMLQPGIENLAGAVTNPMQEAEASKVAIFAVADYTWNTESFDAQQSWVDSMKYIEPDATEAFFTLAKHMSDAYPGGMRLEESEDIKDLLDQITRQLNTGESVKDTAPQLIAELEIIAKAADTFLAETKNENLKNELEPFVNALRDLVLADIKFLQAVLAIEADDKEGVWNSFSLALSLREQSLNYERPMLRGKMKAKPAARRLQPFSNLLEEKVSAQIEDAMGIDVEKTPASIFTNLEQYADLSLTEEPALTSIDEAGKITLGANKYLGVKLSRVKDLTAIQAPEVKGLTLETSLNGTEWETADPENPAHARYVRLINKTDKAISFQLGGLSVASFEVEPKKVIDTNLGFYQSSPDALLDGDLTTHTWTNRAQMNSDFITYDLGQIIPLENLKLFVDEAEGDFPRHAVIEASLDGEQWNTVMTIGRQDGPNEGELENKDRIEDIFTEHQSPYRFIEAKDINQDAKFLRFKITRTKQGVGNWLKMQEILINDGKAYPEVNDPTITSTIDTNTGFDVGKLIDGKINTFFQPAAKEAGEILYHAGETEKTITGITILEDAGNVSNAKVSVRTMDGWESIGNIESGYTFFDVKSLKHILDIKIEWAEGTQPSIYEIHLDKENRATADEIINQLDETLITAYEDGLITNHGILNSLLAKVTQIQKQQGDIKKTLNAIKPLENQVRAQAGKKIDGEFAESFLGMLDELRTELENLQ